MIFEAALLAVLLGLLAGGSLKKLLGLRLRHFWLLAVAAVAGLLPRLPLVGQPLSALGMPAAVAVAVVRYGSLLCFAAFNRRFLPVCVIGLGGLLNFAATLANGGVMPVTAEALRSGTADEALRLMQNGGVLNYRLADAHTRLLPLCDVIRLRLYNIYFLSVGDILIAAGIFVLIVGLMEPRILRRLTAAFPKKSGRN